jgi:YTH domain-containing family protein
MLELFKYTRAEGCVLDDFMVHEEKEASCRQLQRLKLRPGAPHFIPAWHGPRTSPVLPKSDSMLMDRIVSGTNNLTDKLQNLNLGKHHGSWQEFGNLTSEASTTNKQKESHCYGNQVHENPVKARPSPTPTYQPVASDVKSASGGEQQCWKKVEIIPTGKPQPETVARVSLKAPPEEHRKEGKNALVHSASGAPGMTCEEEKIVGKPCSPAFDSTTSKACSKPLPAVVAIGSMLIPITTSN